MTGSSGEDTVGDTVGDTIGVKELLIVPTCLVDVAVNADTAILVVGMPNPPVFSHPAKFEDVKEVNASYTGPA